MIVLDANVMIAVLDIADAHFHAATEILEANADKPLLTHRLAAAETLVLAARTGRADEAAEALHGLGIDLDDAPDDPLELAALRARTGLRMPDCCVLLCARRAGADLATFDIRLAGAARDAGLTVLGS